MNDEDDHEKFQSAPARPIRRASPLMIAVAAAALMSASVDGGPRERLPLPPPPNDPPPLPPTMKARGRHGRSGGSQPLPRAFYSGRLLPGEDPGEIQSLLDQAENRTSDERHLAAAAEKRARKARKRLGK